MANGTLPTGEIESITPATYGPVAAAMVLSTPLVLILSVGDLLVHHKLYGKKQPIAYELSAIQDQPLAKKKRKAHRGRRHSKQVGAMAVMRKYEEVDIKEVLEKETEEKKGAGGDAQQEEEKVVQAKNKKRKVKKNIKKASKQVETPEPEEVKEEKVDAKTFEYTKGLPRSKTIIGGWLPTKEIEESEEFKAKQFWEEACQQEWEVVGKKEKKKREKVVEENIEEQDNKKEVEKETETLMEDDNSSSDVSESTAEIPRELREMAREGRESEERLWFDLDEDFSGPFRG
ncbi:hypothetical protein L207DRAFT_609320 [Hyaloscypha variabilis F]|uniref:Uncharacterized protein n=1 Tax=Hyaloscypha variabilis (strain UAMH 11265 / GT02V1 / F) TaxID=1149755 RepID=A0A2J6R2G9_HYAVF|nr:hypothetical protein L207DRAFT_609320 [Hyaloscypha variabilis F]